MKWQQCNKSASQAGVAMSALGHCGDGFCRVNSNNIKNGSDRNDEQ